MGSASIKGLAGAAIGMATLTVVDLMAIAVAQQFEDTGLVSNTTADAFISGLAIFGTFSAVIVIALIGKLVIQLFQEGNN